MPALTPWSTPNRKNAVVTDSKVRNVRTGLRRSAAHTRYRYFTNAPFPVGAIVASPVAAGNATLDGSPCVVDEATAGLRRVPVQHIRPEAAHFRLGRIPQVLEAEEILHRAQQRIVIVGLRGNRARPDERRDQHRADATSAGPVESRREPCLGGE